MAAGLFTILVLLITLTAGYFTGSMKLLEARDEAIADCNESKEKFRIDAEHFRQARQEEEVDKLKAEQDERVEKCNTNVYRSL